ncbi:hypothetical protein R6Q59_027974 [Mikania micrantha]
MKGRKRGFKIQKHTSQQNLAPISLSFSLGATDALSSTESSGTSSDGSPAELSQLWWMSKFLLTQLQNAMVVTGWYSARFRSKNNTTLGNPRSRFRCKVCYQVRVR